MKMNLLNFFNSRNGLTAETGERKIPVKVLQREREVKFVQKYINELEPDTLFVAQEVHALGRKPLEEAIVKKCDEYHRRKYREYVAGMKQGFANAANQAKNQLPPLYKKRKELEETLHKIPQVNFIKDETGKKQWTGRDRIIFTLFVLAAIALLTAAASAIEAVVITGFPALSANLLRAWAYGIFGGLAAIGTLYGVGYALGQHSEKAKRNYFLILEMIGATATLALVVAIANVGMGTGNQAVMLDFTKATSETASGSSNDFMLVFSEVLAEWIFATICFKKAVEKYAEFGAPTIAKDNPDYPRILAQLGELNRDISDWEEKLADNNALLEFIVEGEERYVQKADALLRARHAQSRLSYGILE